MIHALIALFMRSLRESMRLWISHLARSGLLLMVWLGLVGTRQSFESTGAPGLQFLQVLIGYDFSALLLFGLGYFSSAITEEKEEGILPLLRMTNLSPLAILLGKSTSRLVSALLLLLAQLPFTVLAVTLGGVTLTQAIGAYITLVAFAILLANLCLFASVWTRQSRGAMRMSVWILLLLAWLPNILLWLAKLFATTSPLFSGPTFGKITDLCLSAQELYPFYRINQLLVTGYSGPAVSWQPFSNILVGLAFFLLSWSVFEWRVRKTAMTETIAPVKVAKRSLFSPLRLFRRSSLNTENGFPPASRRAGRFPIFWKDFFAQQGGFRSWWIPVLLFGGYLGSQFLLFNRSVGMLPPMNGNEWKIIIGSCMVFGVFLAVIVGLYSVAGIFQTEIKEKTLSAFMLQPVSFRRILFEKALTVIFRLLPYVLIEAGLLCLMSDHPIADATTLVSWIFQQFSFVISWVVIVLGGLGFICSLIILLSLYLRWATVPVALFLILILYGMMSAFLSPLIIALARKDLYASPASVLITTAIQLGLAYVFLYLAKDRIRVLASRD